MTGAPMNTHHPENSPPCVLDDMGQDLLAYQNLKMTPLFVSLLTFSALSTPCSSQGQLRLQSVLGKCRTTSVYLCNVHTA